MRNTTPSIFTSHSCRVLITERIIYQFPDGGSFGYRVGEQTRNRLRKNTCLFLNEKTGFCFVLKCLLQQQYRSG